MKIIIKNFNKRALADETGISYSRLRKYASGQVEHLTPEEKEKIYIYLNKTAEKFSNK